MKKNIPFSPPDISNEEIEAVSEVLKSGWITTGPKTKMLEKKLSEYTNTPKTVCLNSATAALELILRVLEIGEGDEVIVPALTYTASCSVIYHVGATPILVDINKENFEMDYDLLAEKITKKTKAIIPVDLCGIPCDYDRIFKIVEEKKYLFVPNGKYQEKLGRIAVVTDAAHALGSVYKGKKVGSISDFSAFSFHAVKNFTTAEGGSVTWRENPKFDNEELYKEFQIYSLHGQTKDALSKMKAGSWEYDIVIPGYKCNMTDIMAAIGLVQLKRYPKLLERRYEIANMYDKAFEGTNISFLKHKTEKYLSSHHLYITHIKGANIKQRNKIIVKLAEKGISANVHYKPLPLLTAYKKDFDMSDYPNAYKYYENEITLPLNTLLTDEDVQYIIDTYKKIVKEVL
ncbi:DegT/DnrJ/EryC1/StrS family aminotransferase [Gemelliphila asaccharolytica]|uniref:DegT/DnrJ/EryC1/StrS aminotransferase family protein n=1 Tax=Gemelliphila asaccharolytica TaxID=502393 RepID=A0ABR5TM55_9BACL|nr:DegT/DnrJ/EryC1/StrS aminotransferase family protein [Gemella asaccharolytica]KXB58211.1 DegT/DnrJ/EryC1/StrS aminotransferase family protein [Gemella asaccharolytica]